MLKKQTFLWVACLSLAAFAVAACGTIEKISPPLVKKTKVAGVAATGTPIVGKVTLVDSSSPQLQKAAATAADGSFTFDVRTMTPPYVLRADWTDGEGAQQLFAFAQDGGTANINPLTNAAYASAAGEQDQSALSANLTSAAMHSVKSKHPDVKKKLLRKLAQLFEQYGVVPDPEGDGDDDDDEYEADHRGLDALFDDIKIRIEDGTITVTNKKTKKLIFTAPVQDLDAGTFYPENMPGGSTTTPPNGAALYGQNCSSCHGTLASSDKSNATAAQIHAAITNNTGGMGSLSTLTALEIQAIAAALAQTQTPPPAALDGPTLYAQSCSSCHGPLASSTKSNATALQIQAAITNNVGGMGTLSGLTGPEIQRIAAALVQTTPPAAPDGAALYAAKCAGCHGVLATTSKPGRTAAQIQSAITNNLGGMGSLTTLTAEEIIAIAAVLPAAPPTTPVPPDGTALYAANCASCHGALATTSKPERTAVQIQSAVTNNVGGMGYLASLTAEEVAAIASVLPAATPAACSYTYSAWGACQPDNTQMRTMLTSSPAGCTGTPVLTQSCTYVPPAPEACTYTYSAWGECQPDSTQTRTMLTSSPAGCSGTPALSQTCTYTPPTPACGSCHTIPPASGRHSRHTSFATCATCHGTGYSTTAVNTATHNNGVRDIVSTLNWNAATSTCSTPGCHGSRTW